MNVELSRDKVRELLPAYALGALDADERAAVEAGLSRYPECRAELAQHQATVLGLARAVPPRTPPARVKASLMAAVAPAAPAQAAPSWWQRLIDGLSSSRLALRMTFAALILAAAVIVAQAALRLPAAQQQIAAQQQAQAILAASSESIRLNGTQNAPGAQATIHYSPNEEFAALQVSNLPQLPQTQAYQLWLVDNTGKRWSAAVFNTQASGDSLVLVKCDVPLDDVVRMGISLEPAGGSPAPTGPAVLRGAQS